MNMDPSIIKQLRDAGGLVGFSNEAEWQQLVTTHGLERVLESVVRVKKVSGRGAFISGVRVDLGAKARELVPPKPAIAAAAPPSAPAKVVSVIPLPGGGTMTSYDTEPIAEHAVADEDLEEIDQAEEEAEEEDSHLISNEKPASVADMQPSGEALPSKAADPMAGARKARTLRVTDHYLSILREFPGISPSELAARAGRDSSTVFAWLSTHGELVTKTREGKRSRLWLAGDARIPKEGEPAAAVNEEPAAVNAAPASVNAPAIGMATLTVEIDGDPVVSGATAISASAKAPELVTGEDLRDRLKDAPEPPTAGVVIMSHELAGPLRPLLELLLDAFAHRRGYAHTVRELEGCQDLVGVRR